MLILYILLLIFPAAFAIIGPALFHVEFVEFLHTFGMWWIFLSSVWAAGLVVGAFIRGRTIEVLETAKFAVETVNDNKHHIKSAFSFLKGKVNNIRRA